MAGTAAVTQNLLIFIHLLIQQTPTECHARARQCAGTEDAQVTRTVSRAPSGAEVLPGPHLLATNLYSSEGDRYINKDLTIHCGRCSDKAVQGL